MNYQNMMTDPKRFSKSQIPFFAILIPLALFFVLPIIFIFSTAFKPYNELFAFPPRFMVRRPTLDNFRSIGYVIESGGIPLSRYILNNITSTLLAVVIAVAISLPGAYVLAKKNFKGKRALFTINTLALMFVPASVTIPRYLIIQGMNLIDTFAVLFLPLVAMPVCLFLLKQFIEQIPDSLIESAQIDGAKDALILRRIVSPLVRPATATVAILAFQGAWNAVEPSNIYINMEANRTFSFYLSALVANVGNSVAGAGIIAAASLMLFVPNLIIFIFMQGQVLNTMSHSGLK